MIILLLSLLTFVGCTSTEVVPNKTPIKIEAPVQVNACQKDFLNDNRASAYYLGCVDSFILLQDMGYYARPEGMTGQEVFSNVKYGCNFKTMTYRYDIENLKSEDVE